eukprot:gene5002-biopygen12914
MLGDPEQLAKGQGRQCGLQLALPFQSLCKGEQLVESRFIQRRQSTLHMLALKLVLGSEAPRCIFGGAQRN